MENIRCGCRKGVKQYLCQDCGKDVMVDPRDWYMVTADVWNKFGLGGCVWNDETDSWNGETNGFLCMKCMEGRLGHPVRRNDLMTCLCNFINPYIRPLFDVDKKVVDK